jgi:hypothetical protein
MGDVLSAARAAHHRGARRVTMDATLFEIQPAICADWRDETCWKCGKGFTAKSWDERHQDYEGHDIHAKCCTRVSCRNARIHARHLVTP